MAVENTPVTTEEARAELSSLFEQWLTRIAGGDRSFFAETLDDDWVYTDIFGKVRGKTDYIEYLETDVLPDVTGRLVELTPRLYGELALVTGLYEIEGRLADGTDVSSSSRFTGLWRWTPDGWRSLAHHATTAGQTTGGA